MLLLLSAVVATPLTPEVPGEPAAQVVLAGQRAELDLSGGEPTLRFFTLAANRLSVPLEAVEVGVLFAEQEEHLELADPAKLYRDQSKDGTVGVIRQRVVVTIPPGGEGKLELSRPITPDDPQPRAFRTHVLGYRLAKLEAPLLFALLSTEAAADEVAAVDSLALTAERVRKLEVRQRFGSDKALIDALLAEAQAEAPDKPNQEQLLRRIFAIRALGVLGGEPARGALDELLSAEDSKSWHDLLLVMRAARVGGSHLETPLAFAVPPEARRLQDVVTAALDDLVATTADDAPPAEPAELYLEEKGGSGSIEIVTLVLAVAAGIFALVALVLVIRQRARLPKAQ